jgi:hypothetical protein
MIEEVLDQIYEKAEGVGLGHLVWCPVPQLDEIPRVLEVERESAEKHFASRFRIVQLNTQHFRSRSKLPIAALQLHDTEELLIAKAKRRPCIIVCCNNTAFHDENAVNELKQRKHLQDQSMILAPLYGIATPEDEKGFPPKMVARIRGFLYHQFFYLPKICPKTKLSVEKEGIARLDRLVAASPNRGVQPMNVKLAAEPLKLLLALMCERFGSFDSNDLKSIREILGEAVPPDCRPA